MVMGTILIFDQRLSKAGIKNHTRICKQNSSVLLFLNSRTIKYTRWDQENTNICSVAQFDLNEAVDFEFDYANIGALIFFSSYFTVQLSCYEGGCTGGIVNIISAGMFLKTFLGGS